MIDPLVTFTPGPSLSRSNLSALDLTLPDVTSDDYDSRRSFFSLGRSETSEKTNNRKGF